MIVDHPNLSPRENEVATLVAKGVRSKGIAEVLGLSDYTVNSYLRRIFAKLLSLADDTDVEDAVLCPHCGGKLA